MSTSVLNSIWLGYGSNEFPYFENLFLLVKEHLYIVTFK